MDLTQILEIHEGLWTLVSLVVIILYGAALCRIEQNILNMSGRQTRQLQFKNPGRFMQNFDPECSRREMRKVQRRFYRESSRHHRAYDEKGHRLADGLDICDCLVKSCPGCHMPCPRCSSTKCGAECRCNRCWFYGVVETEGIGTKVVCDLLVSPSNVPH